MYNGKICFILYKPAVPGNIGAAARAIKTMGFNELRLIAPIGHLSDEARMLAHGSADILENSSVYSSYEEAVEDLDFVVCTTAKSKSAKVDYIPSNKLADFIAEKIPLTKKIGVVFGTEESGLPNSIIRASNAGVTIPMKTEYPSLNLSQAVMIIAYELSQYGYKEQLGINEQSGITEQSGSNKKLGTDEQSGINEQSCINDRAGTNEQSGITEQSGTNEQSDLYEPQSESTWKQLQERVAYILTAAGIKPATPLYHRILERISFLNASDARLVHSISSKLKDLTESK